MKAEVLVYYCDDPICGSIHRVPRGTNYDKGRLCCPTTKKTNLRRKCLECGALVTRLNNKKVHKNCRQCKEPHPNTWCNAYVACQGEHFEKESQQDEGDSNRFTVHNVETMSRPPIAPVLQNKSTLQFNNAYDHNKV
jgi:hypothetical protein